MLLDEEEILKTTPVAHGAGIIRCIDPRCGLPHIVLFDADGNALLQFPVSPDDANGKGFFAALKAAVEKKDS
jgi:hypothetical protein